MWQASSGWKRLEAAGEATEAKDGKADRPGFDPDPHQGGLPPLTIYP